MHSAFAGYAPRRDRLMSALAAAKEHLALPALTERRLTLVRPRNLPLIRNRHHAHARRGRRAATEHQRGTRPAAPCSGTGSKRRLPAQALHTSITARPGQCSRA